METTATELLRALRGTRSQIAFARRLGYRSNVAADWEQGRRAPTAAEALRIASVVGVDVTGALEAFQTGSAEVWGDGGAAGVAGWLAWLRGGRALREVAEQVGRDRQAVWRWLSGRAEPRLPDFLALVDALTGRVTDLLAALVDVRDLPSVEARHAELLASRTVGLEHPWSLAVLMLLQTPAYAALPAHDDAVLAAWSGISTADVRTCLDALEASGLVRPGHHYTAVGDLTLDTRADDRTRARLRAHWTRVVLDRIEAPRPDDVISYNVFAVSHADLARIRALQRELYRSVRSIVAASPSTEAVALLNMQTIGLGPGNLSLEEAG
ncbi:MAG: DUF4423 domain-containing protein [Myxococcales bacterium]|nr:DUF4423 domain-containing protein [Myxococcales bacterium]